MKYQRARGTRDILPPEARARQDMADSATEILRCYGYRLMEIPVFEKLELFVRSIGEATDIVEKEMFTFEKGDETYALRPEGTAGIARAFVEERMAVPAKLAYWGPIFRAERPQKGRLRQFTQLGIECFGPKDPELDAEQVELGLAVFRAWGLPDVTVLLNSIGCPDDRVLYRQALSVYLKDRISDLCEDCQRRIERNPVRALDCKQDGPKLMDAPRMLEYLCDECRAHYEGVKQGLGRRGISFREEPRLWRGLDYYTRTVFEFRAKGLGAQDAVGGGGRYDLLVEELGGQPTPASGWALGIERAQIAMESRGIRPEPRGPDFFVVTIGPRAREKGLELVGSLREAGKWVEFDYDDSGPGKQFKLADRAGARFALVIGDDELARGVVKLRDMETGEERFVAPGELAL